MADWEPIAIKLFPEIYAGAKEFWEDDLNIYGFLTDFTPKTREAHLKGDLDFIRKAHGFADWAFHQGEQDWDLMNAFAVSFYEDVLRGVPDQWETTIPWLPPEVTEQVLTGWNLMLSDHDISRIREIIRETTEWRYQENIYRKGELKDAT